MQSSPNSVAGQSLLERLPDEVLRNVFKRVLLKPLPYHLRVPTIRALPLLSKRMLDALRRADIVSGCTLSANSPAEALAKAALSAWRLGRLNLSFCSALVDVAPLANCQALHTLDLSYCSALVDVAPLANCQALHTLDLSRCDALVVVVPLAKCQALHTLNLSGCDALEDVVPLAGCQALHTLDLSFCTALVDVVPLANCQALHTLNLSGCTALVE